MIDGADMSDAQAIHLVGSEADESTAYAHAARANANTPGPDALIEWLPRLGSVLWLERCDRSADRPAPSGTSHALLLDHPALKVLSSSRQLRSHHAITAHGPREWLCFHSASGAVEAKLFLLPDSDLLAWDEMNAALHVVASTTDRHDPPTHSTFLGRALGRFGQRWQARLLEFGVWRRPWLSVLDARPPLRISLLGIDVARAIVRDEYAEWISPHLN